MLKYFNDDLSCNKNKPARILKALKVTTLIHNDSHLHTISDEKLSSSHCHVNSLFKNVDDEEEPSRTLAVLVKKKVAQMLHYVYQE